MASTAVVSRHGKPFSSPILRAASEVSRYTSAAFALWARCPQSNDAAEFEGTMVARQGEVKLDHVEKPYVDSETY